MSGGICILLFILESGDPSVLNRTEKVMTKLLIKFQKETAEAVSALWLRKPLSKMAFRFMNFDYFLPQLSIKVCIFMLE